MKSKILIVAAEASSVLYAEQLIHYWKNRGIKNEYYGVGSRSLESLGVQCFGYAEDMAVMGFTEVLKHYNQIKKVFNRILEEVDKNRPEVAVLLDYPGFNLRLSKELHARGIPVIYYISPQIWAWKKNRVYQVKAYVTKMLVVFPFEVDFYKQYDVPVEYVGHPLLDEMKIEYFNESLLMESRGKLGLNSSHRVLGLMPGSRKQEIERHLAVQLQVAESLSLKYPDLRVLLLVAPTLDKEMIQSYLGNLSFPIKLIQDEPFKMIRLTDAVLATSGTATLMVGLLEKPMVIIYKVSWLTGVVGRRLVKGFFGLVNILSKHEIVPEIFQSKVTVENLVPLVERSLYDQEYRKNVIEDLKTLKKSLGDGGVTERVAKAIETTLASSKVHSEKRD